MSVGRVGSVWGCVLRVGARFFLDFSGHFACFVCVSMYVFGEQADVCEFWVRDWIHLSHDAFTPRARRISR
jgi:hypothetical protein